ncbi:30S ribosomal protein S4 [Frankia canadensis]|uniref:Small ribosomal subunit protein uS4 n=1 Tax=Frankia canadensis TaxID=1836972 RepID=A0A2I2KWF1_9ACTN|nr:30S ribosomal protein S4 [Frankia canadensis]SNQ49976.1 30S ribosomal protein S4 [Frankia canadensis]SOU57266.1 30S ribosomal protein S4 [Frankia canadensis]
MRHKPVVKLSRSLGLPLSDKAVRYYERRPFPPGVHGQRRVTMTPYKERLREKQRLRFQYHISEKQLRAAFTQATRSAGRTGHALLEDLETRLDATVWRSGLAKTIYQARQFVSHGHIHVNGRGVDRPGRRVQPGDVISVAPRSRSTPPFRLIADGPAPTASTPPYLKVHQRELTVITERRPRRPEIPIVCDEQLVVEYYAR